MNRVRAARSGSPRAMACNEGGDLVIAYEPAATYAQAAR